MTTLAPSALAAPGPVFPSPAVPGAAPSGLASIDLRLLAAHAVDDRVALAALYGEAGGSCEARGEIDRACFYLTHAYVFALEMGLEAAVALRAKLVGYGREE